MTRAELAEKLDGVLDNIYHPTNPAIEVQAAATVCAAAALLRQSCAGCRHFEKHETGAQCEAPVYPDRGRLRFEPVPADGSGHCWQWEAKP